jgi:hypothetical protein
VAGYEQITTKIDNLNTTVTFNGLPDYSIVTTSSSTTTATGTYDPNGLIKSYFGRVNYNFDQRYYVSGSIRQDANYTVFGPDMQKGVPLRRHRPAGISVMRAFSPACYR